MQNFVENVSEMQHYRPGLHLKGRTRIDGNKGPDVMNGGGNL